MKKFLFFLIMILLSYNLFGKDFQITTDGRATATVVISKNANPSEKFAANEFVKYINLISGAELRITDKLVEGNKIFIGEEKNLTSYLSGVNTLKTTIDTVIIKTKGNDKLILAGGGKNGVIYSVYTFLEDYLGVKYILPDEDYIPENYNISVHNIDYVYTPPFLSRETYYLNNTWKVKSNFNLKHKQNGVGTYIPDKLVDKVEIIGFAHTVDNLMNPDEYGKEHPEWFALRDGKRILKKGYTQPCFSNPEMIKELTKNLIKTIEEKPGHKIYSVTQSDNDNYCECDKCEALALQYNQSGLLLYAINQIADSVKEKYPDVLIDTFAYHYTQLPPKGDMKPRDNVLIRYCPRSNQIAPITEKCNNVTYTEIDGWSKISKQLFIWDYSGDFFNYLLPFPNTQIFQDNMKLWAKKKAVAMLNLGDYQNSNTWLLPYKDYILCKLSWNPNINLRAEAKTFMDLYYGPAGNIMYSYMLWNEGIMPNKDINLDRRYESANYYTFDEIIKSYDYLNSALDATKGDEKYYNRVWCDYICFTAGVMSLQPNLRSQIRQTGIMRIEDQKELNKELMEFGLSHGITYDRESRKLVDSPYAKPEQEHKLPKPEICKDLPNDDWFEFTPEDIKNQSNRDEISKVVEDASAPSGKSRWISYDKYWPTQLYLSELFQNDSIKYIDVYATYRVEKGDKEGKAYEIGFYSYSQKEYFGKFFINNTDTPDGKYITKKINTFDYLNTSPDVCMYICGVHDNEIDKGLYLDRIFFVYRY